MKPRPNLLRIVTDQQRFDTIHAAGNQHIFTPHLNWLMDTGTIFRRAYVDAPIMRWPGFHHPHHTEDDLLH